MSTKGHSLFQQRPPAPDRRALNHVQPTSHAPPDTASVNPGVVIFSGMIPSVLALNRPRDHFDRRTPTRAFSRPITVP
jgi:hypothetical protein